MSKFEHMWYLRLQNSRNWKMKVAHYCSLRRLPPEIKYEKMRNLKEFVFLFVGINGRLLQVKLKRISCLSFTPIGTFTPWISLPNEHVHVCDQVFIYLKQKSISQQWADTYKYLLLCSCQQMSKKMLVRPCPCMPAIKRKRSAIHRCGLVN